MVLSSGAVECLFCVGCARWGWRRCTHAGADDSAAWPPATLAEFAPVPRACRAVLASYEDDLADPQWAPDRPGGYAMDPAGVAKRATYEDTRGRCPPYLVYVDAGAREVVLAVRGLNLARDADYRLLLDEAPAGGARPFDGGYVHLGLLRAAAWLLEQEGGTLRRLLREGGPEYSLVLSGHSLGAGVAALATVLIVNGLDRFGGLPRSRVRCYAIAPARCMSLNLAVKYADVINSVVLQDDCLPRTPTPLQHIFGSIFCLPCLLSFVCMRDTFTRKGKSLKDPKRLYAPGRMYHIVERKPCRCGRFPPEVRTAIPAQGSFEHIVLSCNSIFDHGIIWMEKEAQKAMEIMSEKGDEMAPPTRQTMVGKAPRDMEHKSALERTVSSINMPSPAVPAKVVSEDSEQQFGSWSPESYDISSSSSSSEASSDASTDWDDIVQKLFDVDERGDVLTSARRGRYCF